MDAITRLKRRLNLTYYINGNKICPHVRFKGRVTMGKNNKIKYRATFKGLVVIGAQNVIGEHNRLHGPISLGSGCYLAPMVALYARDHDLCDSTKPGEQRLITLENNVWLGYGVIVLKGVTLGNSCVIGAGSVVTRDIPANAIAVGNPAKVIGDKGRK